MTNQLSKKIDHIPNLTVVSAYFHPKIGGLETIAYTTAKKLHTSGEYNVSIITSNYAGTGYKKEIIDGMTVHRLPIWFVLSNSPINPLWYSQIKKIYKKEQTDIVHTHSPVPFMADVAVFAAQSEHIPTVSTYHSGGMKKGKWWTDVIIYFYEEYFLRALFKKTNKVVTVHQEFMKKNYPEVGYKTFFIPTGVDLKRFTPTALPENDMVTFVGRIEHSSSWKGIEQLLQAMVLVLKERPEVKLTLVGGGDALAHYTERTKSLGISDSVFINGPKFGLDLVKAYAETTLIALPSTSDSEAFSVTLVEAQASGRPIIGTTTGGTPQVIQDGENGLLVPPKDPQALADAILRILGDRKLAEQMSEAGSKKSKEFSWEIQTKKYSLLFEELLNNTVS